jgi:hypothetical protein
MTKQEVINKVIEAIAAKKCWLDTTESPNEFFSEGMECDGTLYTIQETEVTSYYSSEYGSEKFDSMTFEAFLNEHIEA